MSSQKNSKARQATRGGALLDGALRGEPTTGGASGALLPLEPPVREPTGPVDCAAAAHARTRADAGAVRLSPLARDDASGRLGCGQASFLSRVHRGGPGAQTEAAVASCDRGPSRAPAARPGPQRDLEYGLCRRPARRRATVPGVDGDRSLYA